MINQPPFNFRSSCDLGLLSSAQTDSLLAFSLHPFLPKHILQKRGLARAHCLSLSPTTRSVGSSSLVPGVCHIEDVANLLALTVQHSHKAQFPLDPADVNVNVSFGAGRLELLHLCLVPFCKHDEFLESFPRSFAWSWSSPCAWSTSVDRDGPARLFNGSLRGAQKPTRL